MKGVLYLGVLAFVIVCVKAWGSSDKVLLKDVDVITLYQGRQTNARRTGAIPQLQCVGGGAASYFKPQVVQCYNRGSDGSDVQWECKTDMDNAYRFGTVRVSCEGYEYPDDPYILKGSCGLEYTLELTKEGYEQQARGGGGHHNSYGGGHNSYGSKHNYGHHWKSSGSSFGNLVFFVIVALVIYGIYKTCIAPAATDRTNGGQPGGYPRQPTAPPPPGFRPEYSSGAAPGGPPPSYDDCTSGRYSSTVPPTEGATHTPNNGGGFWSGAATGGILGYLFGSRTQTNYHQPHYGGRRWGGGWGNGWGSGWGSGWGNRNTGWGSSWGNSGWGRGSGWGNSGGWGSSGSTRSSSSSSSSSSTGTRTASGFGGTTRR